MVIDPQSPRGHWPLGRVVQCIPGKDGIVRVAKLARLIAWRKNCGHCRRLVAKQLAGDRRLAPQGLGVIRLNLFDKFVSQRSGILALRLPSQPLIAGTAVRQLPLLLLPCRSVLPTIAPCGREVFPLSLRDGSIE
uniref:DUF5641 domain-containing protein n=1 Tax=Trichuris muris TaxID=70415 RepID=A0A5S6QBG9_TRIMR